MGRAPRHPPVRGGRVSATSQVSPEPVQRSATGTGSGLSERLAPAIAQAVEWAGEGLQALVLSGSHATGEAVWFGPADDAISISDLDLYAVMCDDAACDAARQRARAGRAAWADSPGAKALAGALEVAFVTREGLARMPARPGTVTLGRSAIVVWGDAAVRDAIPHWEPAAVDAEERLLLLENRAFELLYAALAPTDGLDAVRARHAVLKTALDAASARALARGEWPARVTTRIERARVAISPAVPLALDGAWAGLWRARGAHSHIEVPLEPAWRAAVRGWCAVWWEVSGAWTRTSSAYGRALAVARRGSIARRLRRSLAFRATQGPTAPVLDRLLRSFAGTPAQRIHGSAVVLLLAAATGARPALPREASAALATLGVTRATGWDAAARETFEAWDRGLHEGLRCGGGR
ncbi:MAG: hypothetical protein RL721_940 [Candidatus Eisenbacteria bacterium]